MFAKVLLSLMVANAAAQRQRNGYCCYWSSEMDTADWCSSCAGWSQPDEFCGRNRRACEGRCVGDGPPKVWCLGDAPAPPPTDAPVPPPTPMPPPEEGRCCYYSPAEATADVCGTCESWSQDGEYCGESQEKCEVECVGTDRKVWCPGY